MTPKEALKLMSDVCMSTMINLPEETQEKVIEARKVLKGIFPEEEKPQSGNAAK